MADLLWVLGIAAYLLIGVAVARWCREGVRKTQTHERQYGEMMSTYGDKHMVAPATFGAAVLGLCAVLWPIAVVMLIVLTFQDNTTK